MLNENSGATCSFCVSRCSSHSTNSINLKEPLNEQSKVKKVIAVVSGKGGVGKSLITSMLSVKANAQSYKVAILDADVTGPSIPKTFGLASGVMVSREHLMIPATTSMGIQVMSANLLLENETDPVLWRGPVIASSVKQFWQETYWKDIDIMFVDMPPGTGDVALTVFQSLPIDGIIIVTSPQELVSMIVEKGVNMAKKMNIPILGIIENMSYFKCDNCNKEHKIFGESHIDSIATAYGIDILAKIPIDPNITIAVDSGTIEYLNMPWLDDALIKIL